MGAERGELLVAQRARLDRPRVRLDVFAIPQAPKPSCETVSPVFPKVVVRITESLLAAVSAGTTPGAVSTFTWRPRTKIKGKLRFSVQSWDAAGHKSPISWGVLTPR